MSQVKVDHHKELKRNRKKIVRRQKRLHSLHILAGVVVAVIALGFIAYSGYGVYQNAHANDPLPAVKCDLTAINDYVADINAGTTN